LASALLLFHITEYTTLSLPSRVQLRFICDNAGLIHRLKTRRTYEVVYPNATLAADWDLTEQIHRFHQRIDHARSNFEWVKGHQDDNNSIDDLDSIAAFNVRADFLATEYLQTYPVARPIVPMTPATRCQLEVNGRTVTSHCTAALRKAASEPALLQYLLTKHHWTSDILGGIDWDSLRSAARNYPSSDVHLLKLVHDKLPTKYHKAKFQPWVTRTCAYCHQVETFDHLMQCSNTLSATFRQYLDQAINEYGERRSVPQEFTRAYLDGLQQWLQGHQPTVAHPRIDQAQSAIGWRLFIRGFLSTEWHTYLTNLLQANADATHTSREDDTDPTCWNCDIDMRPNVSSDFDSANQDTSAILSGLIRIVWREMSAFWERHLDHIHAHKQQSSPAKIHELKTQIRQLHTYRNSVLPAHRTKYFQHDLQAYLEKANQWQLEQYVLHYKPAILTSMRREKVRQQQHTANIPSLFSFAGFTRHTTTLPSYPSNRRPEEETHHPKHTRWRPGAMVVATFRHFFQQNPTNP
jgi:cytochrome c553